MIDDIQDKKLHEAIDALPRDIAPKRNLWPGIDEQIAPAPRRRFPYGLAAAAVVVIAVGALVTAVLLDRPAAPDNSFVVVPTVQHSPAVTMPSTPRATMLAASVRRTTQHDPQLQAVLLHNLAIVERSLADIRVAMQQSPNDAGLQRLLFQMYHSEATLLIAAQHIELQSTLGVAQL